MNKSREKRSLTVNFIMNALLSFSSILFPLITFRYASHILGPERMGTVSMAVSFVSYFTMVSQLGIPLYGIRACAKVQNDREQLTRTAHELLLINLLMAVLAYAALAAAIVLIPRIRVEKTLYVIISSNIILSAVGMEWLYKALEQYSYITIRSIIFKIISLAGMFLLIHSRSDYVLYGGITIFAAVASNILNLINVWHYIDLKPVGGYDLRKHMKPVLVFFAMTCATMIYTNLDTVMLGFMTTDTDVGYYHAAVRVKTLLTSLITSLGAVLLPRASLYIEEKRMDRFLEISARALRFVALSSVPVTIYFSWFAKEGILLLSGGEFLNSVMPMQIIMPTVILIGFSNIIGLQMMVPLGMERFVLYSEIAGAAVDFVLNWLLIPGWRSSGAALGTLAAEAVVLLFQLAVMRKTVGAMFKELPYGKLLAACLAAFLAASWVKGLGAEPFLTLLISALLFFGVYAAVLLLLRESMAVEITGRLLGRLKRG